MVAYKPCSCTLVKCGLYKRVAKIMKTCLGEGICSKQVDYPLMLFASMEVFFCSLHGNSLLYFTNPDLADSQILLINLHGKNKCVYLVNLGLAF